MKIPVKKTPLLVTGAILGVLFLFYLAFLNFVEPHEAGISWNYVSGEVEFQKPGWHLTPPWVAVSRIDTRPIRVCVTSSTRAFNCRLAQFVPDAFKDFIATEGFRYYWWANRISFNFGYSLEYRGWRDIIRGYAYSSEPYPFIQVLEEYEAGE